MNLLSLIYMMTSTMPLALILLAVLSFSFYYLVQAEGGWGEFPRLMERVGINADQFSIFNFQFSKEESLPGSSLPNEWTSGSSRFSRGACAKGRDCFAGGCSGEVCGNEKDAISTCEYSEDFPSTEKFECGCVNKVCGWREK